MTNPCCPHCWTTVEDDFLWYGEVGTEDGDVTKVECPSCSKPFVIAAYVETNFNYYTVEDALDHGVLDEDEAA